MIMQMGAHPSSLSTLCCWRSYANPSRLEGCSGRDGLEIDGGAARLTSRAAARARSFGPKGPQDDRRVRMRNRKRGHIPVSPFLAADRGLPTGDFLPRCPCCEFVPSSLRDSGLLGTPTQDSRPGLTCRRADGAGTIRLRFVALEHAVVARFF